MNQLRAWLYGSTSSADGKQKQGLTSSTISLKNDSVNKQEYPKIPLAPGDCLECKLVGTSVMAISGLIIMTSAVASKKRRPDLVGFRGAIYFILCCGLFAGFETLAVCRLFDIGPFQKKGGSTETSK